MASAGAIIARTTAPLQRCLATKWTRSPSRCMSMATAKPLFGHGDERSATPNFHTILSRDKTYYAETSRSISSSGIRSASNAKKTKMMPRKAALGLTPKARDLFQKIIAATSSEGIILKYELSTQHALRMAFKFDLIKDMKTELTAQDEGVSLEVLEDGTPKLPSESWDDNLPKLYIHHNAFMKVLGGTLDVDFNPETGDMTPKLFDREGNEMDPNA